MEKYQLQPLSASRKAEIIRNALAKGSMHNSSVSGQVDDEWLVKLGMTRRDLEAMVKKAFLFAAKA
ncbi:hypothetical protein AAEY27_15780 [Kosakonia sp. BYX6]|uniref:Uncharacterized protein n=1 Tax=Kosakonia calanthes TaxID=3139408 RepID=A0ABZ3B1V0_9ENTR